MIPIKERGFINPGPTLGLKAVLSQAFPAKGLGFELIYSWSQVVYPLVIDVMDG